MFSDIQTDIDQNAVVRYVQANNLKIEVEELARPLIDEGKTPGVAVGVLLPDASREFYGFGTVEQNRQQNPSRTTLFAIGSTTKGFTAATAAVLVQEGKLNWDDTLGDLLSDDYPLSRDAKQITLMQLATHSSGLPRQPMGPRTLLYFIQFQFRGSNFYRHFDRDYIFNYLSRFNTPFFSDHRYSNIAFGLLGYVLEHITEKELATLIHEKLLSPLELEATGFNPQKLPGYERRARSHGGDHPKFVRRGSKIPEWEFPDILLGAAGLYSNAEDLLDFAHAHLYSVDDETLNRALEDTIKVRLDDTEPRRALAWAVDEVNGKEIIFQIGYVSGYSAYIGMDPANKTAVVVLQNSLYWTERVGHRLLLLMGEAASNAN